MILLGLRVSFLFSSKAPPAARLEGLLGKQGRMFYNIPARSTTPKFQYRINEQPPADAKEFPLRGLNLRPFDDTPDFNKIPKLQHGLNKLLDGRIHMGHMGFGRIPQVAPEVIAQMSEYVPPSQDKSLQAAGERSRCKYSSSTSSISIPLIHLYFLFSMFRRPCFDNVYEQNNGEGIRREHMNHFKKPSTFYLTRRLHSPQGAAYSLDADKGYNQERINEVLMQLGTLAEYLLTHTPETIGEMLKSGVVGERQENYYRYCAVNDNLLLRSQIDCRDIDENGNPFVFQIKTRACCPIRYDVENWKLYKEYPIREIRGKYESFEREYYDLVRGAFIKYAFQLKIGRMHGAFVAYHNTQDIYGYEYVTLKEMVMRLFGDQYNLDVSFQICCRMLTQIFDYILEDTRQYEYGQLKVGFYANSVTKSLNVLVEVMSEVKDYPSVVSSHGIEEYFQRHVSELKNPVFKYDFSFFTYLNGVVLRHPEIYCSPADNLKMRWKVKKLGRIQREEYISFLREAYKEDFIFGSQKYYGNWAEATKIREWQ